MLAKREKEVNYEIRNFQTVLWRERGQPKNNREILNSFNIIEAIEFLGYKVHECELIPGGGIGYLNKPAKQVLVKSNLSKQRKLYTLAHELSHILLHRDMDVLHREEHYKNNQYRPDIEVEADYGASLFLMPEKIVRSEFKKRFLSDPLIFNENVVFHLIKNPRERDAVLNAKKT